MSNSCCDFLLITQLHQICKKKWKILNRIIFNHRQLIFFENVTNVSFDDFDLKNILMHISNIFFFEFVDRNQCNFENENVCNIRKNQFFNLICQCFYYYHDFVINHLHFFIENIDSIILIFFRHYFISKTWLFFFIVSFLDAA